MPIYAKELQSEYSAAFVTVFLGANDAVLEHGPDKAQYVSLKDYRANLQKILHTVRPLLAPHGQVLLITPPCVIDSARRNDRSNASAAKYAKVCVELAAAENVHVLDLHTYFNTTFPDVNVRKTYFVDGLHFSEKGNKEVGKLLGVAINGMFDKEELDRFNKWQLPDWHDLVPHQDDTQDDEAATQGGMLKCTRNDTPTGEDLELGDSATPAQDIQLNVLGASDAETSTTSSDSEDQTFVGRTNVSTKSSVEKLPEPPKPLHAPPTKVLFLDGVRGLAAILVVAQHSKEYLQGFNLGAVAVDAFFVLSSFLLTWLFMKKSMKLLAQGAGIRVWVFALVDYFSKRFFRVYPLFAITAIGISFMSAEDQRRYFLFLNPGDFDLYQVLTFEFNHRQFVLWTLPLEISFYFVIPVFVLVILGMRRFWWFAVAPLAVWVVHQGIYEYRTSHTPLEPHIPTFLSGSLAAVVFVKLDSWIKSTGFKFRWWHTLMLRAVEGLSIAVLLSVCFKGLFFDWVKPNPSIPALASQLHCGQHPRCVWCCCYPSALPNRLNVRHIELGAGKMLQDAGDTKPRNQNEGDTVSPSGAVQLQVIDLSEEETSTSSSDSEDQTFVGQATSTKSSVEKLPESNQAAPQTKVLFLDGLRGLAAMMVVVQHSREFVPSLHLGSAAVDVFFILSSFLLTWLFMKKSMKLLAQGAGVRTWVFTLLDYFQKRFFRVYPLFAVIAIVLHFLSFENQHRYFIVHKPNQVELYETLTFEYEHRYHVFWTLPLEIEYYFIIPVFVLVILRMRRYWWVGAVPLFVWIVHEGWTLVRNSHTPLSLHLHTFMLGSLAAVVFVKIDLWIKKTGFKFRLWHTVLLRAVEYLLIALMLSVLFRGLLFDWVMANPAPPPEGFPFISVYVASILVIEIIHPSCVSTMFEWNVFRFWGKISFSIYLLHTFVVKYPAISHQPNYFNRLFARLFLVIALATASYYAIEYPSQLMAQRISRFLAAQEKKCSVAWGSSHVWRKSTGECKVLP
ncbi:SGNH hydrolase-type esterase domain [Phytophthora cactorum]|nr:SGNH hydrolase-type esterase domain [Phytophthora cactorum]